MQDELEVLVQCAQCGDQVEDVAGAGARPGVMRMKKFYIFIRGRKPAWGDPLLAIVYAPDAIEALAMARAKGVQSPVLGQELEAVAAPLCLVALV